MNPHERPLIRPKDKEKEGGNTSYMIELKVNKNNPKLSLVFKRKHVDLNMDTYAWLFNTKDDTKSSPNKP